MNRISRPTMFMEIAHTVAKRATCMRLSVGAVMVHDRNIASIGYNGSPAGAEHCLGNSCPGKLRCERTVHAEANALAFAGDTPGPFDLYVTDSPCEACYRQLVRDGRTRRIFFATPYRVNEHLEATSIEGRPAPDVYRITPSGYVMNWRTRELEDVPS
jgi:dCMP deaminase